MTTELKPCPFCGGDPVEAHERYADWVTCDTCEAEGPHDDPDGSKWNAAPRSGDDAD